MVNRYWTIPTLLIIVFAFCCTPQGKLNRTEKRIMRLVDKYPALLEKDTISITDTLILNEIKSDTTFSILFDTITLRKDRLMIRAIRIRDSIYLEGTVRADTIIKEILVPYEKIVVKERTWFEKNKWWLMVLGILLLLLMILILFKEAIKKLFK